MYCTIGNAKGRAIIKDIQVIGVRSLQETIDYLILQEKDKASFLVPAEYDNDTDTGEDSYDVDFADINGQGDHEKGNGSGGSRVSSYSDDRTAGPVNDDGETPAYNTARPDYGRKSEVSTIYSVAGQLDTQKALITRRPFSPHHTISEQALAGGRQDTQTGSDLLAHRVSCLWMNCRNFEGGALAKFCGSHWKIKRYI